MIITRLSGGERRDVAVRGTGRKEVFFSGKTSYKQDFYGDENDLKMGKE